MKQVLAFIKEQERLFASLFKVNAALKNPILRTLARREPPVQNTTISNTPLSQFLECGAGGNSCLFLSVAVGVSGSTTIAPLLRRLGSVSLLAYADTIYQKASTANPTPAELENFVKMVIDDEVKWCTKWSADGAVGQAVIFALAEGLNFGAEYSMRTFTGPKMNWEDYQSTRVGRPDYIGRLFLYHTGYFHWQLGVPKGWHPLLWKRAACCRGHQWCFP